MKNFLMIVIALLVMALAGLAWMNFNQPAAEPVPEPIRGESGEILSDPANSVRAKFVAPEPDSIDFN